MAAAGAALRLRLLYRTLRAGEVLALVAFLSWTSSRVPSAAAAALRLAGSLLLNARFVFVLGNAIVLLLLALSRRERDLPAASASSSGQQAASPASAAAPAAADPTASFDSFAAAAAAPPGASPEAAAVASSFSAPSHPPPPPAATEELAAPRAFEDQSGVGARREQAARSRAAPEPVGEDGRAAAARGVPAPGAAALGVGERARAAAVVRDGARRLGPRRRGRVPAHRGGVHREADAVPPRGVHVHGRHRGRRRHGALRGRAGLHGRPRRHRINCGRSSATASSPAAPCKVHKASLFFRR